MIDTDKYERILKDDDGRNNVFALDLLAEVKRLREGIIDVMVKSGHYGTTSEMVKALGKVIE